MGVNSIDIPLSVVFILFSDKNIQTVFITMGNAHGIRTVCVDGEAVQSLILQAYGLQTTATGRGR